MPKILVLSQHVANQIAAGEVVERPASVVKELVENSIDAGSTVISVEIEDGGMTSILVADNGSGIQRDDCIAAFLRHATSKISNAGDLYSIKTLGFRGEALASIASVAEVTLITKVVGEECGTKLSVNMGVLEPIEDTVCNIGTSLRVGNLFLNIPARLKFMKSPRTEAGYIGDYMSRVMMAHPEIEFRYISNGKTLYQTTGDGNLMSVVYSVYGSDIADNLLPIDFDNGYVKIGGYVGNAEISKSNRTYQSIFVNGRYIKSSAISFTLSRAYETKLTIGRFPFAILKITIACQEVDVNVHPAKIEVRFTDEARVNSCIYSACANALANLNTSVFISTPNTTNYQPTQVQEQVEISKSTFNGSHPVMRETVYSPVHSDGYYEVLDKVRQYAAPLSLLTEDSDIKVVGCIFSTYWLIEWKNSVYFVDQHAAHERALYEKIINKSMVFAAQNLLVPKTMTVIPSDYERLEASKEQLEALGFVWEELESNRIKIKSVPQLNGKIFDERYLLDCIEIIAEQKDNVPKELLNEKMIQCACKHAVKGGDVLTETEILALLKEYSANVIPLTCPHGRPIITKLDKTDIEKMFKRIQ